MSGSAARKIRRRFVRAAGGSMERAEAAADQLEDLQRQIGGLVGYIHNVDDRVNRLANATKDTVREIGETMGGLVQAHNSVAAATAKIIEELAKHGVVVTPPPGAPGAPTETAAGIALPPGVNYIEGSPPADEQGGNGDPTGGQDAAPNPDTVEVDG